MTSRDAILSKIRTALEIKTAKPFPDEPNATDVFVRPSGDMPSAFTESFARVNGNLIDIVSESDAPGVLRDFLSAKGFTKIYCREAKMSALLSKAGVTAYTDLATCDISVTDCEYLIARTGSIFLSTASESGRTAGVYAPLHLCIAGNSQIVSDVSDALEAMANRYGNDLPSFMSLATGPSRTADIEKTLVTGVHGPGEVYCLLISDN